MVNVIDWVKISKFDESGDFIEVIKSEIIKLINMIIFVIIQYIF